MIRIPVRTALVLMLTGLACGPNQAKSNSNPADGKREGKPADGTVAEDEFEPPTEADLATLPTARAPLIDPAPNEGADLAALAAAADRIVVGLVVTSSQGKTDCQVAGDMTIQIVAIAKGRSSSADTLGVWAREPSGACKKKALPVIKTAPGVSFQRPTLFFLGGRYSSWGENGLLVPTIGGYRFGGFAVLGAAPLSALGELSKLGFPRPDDVDPVLPSGKHRFKTTRTTAFDKATGLMWQRKGPPSPISEVKAGRYCATLNLGGKADWRLPSLFEVNTLFRYGDVPRGAPTSVFSQNAEAWHWTSTDDDGAWVFAPRSGETVSTHYDIPSPYGPYRAFCVRTAVPRPLPLSTPRFRAEGETIFDLRSGLAWHAAKDTQSRTFDQAKKHCASLRAGAASKWQLPTVTQALSLAALDQLAHDDPEWLAVDKDERSMWTRTRISNKAKRGEVYVMRAPGSPTFWPAGGMGEQDAPRANAICVRRHGEKTPPLVLEKGAVYEAHYANGVLAATGSYKDGLRTGPWKFSSWTGKPIAEVEYRGGLVHGTVTVKIEDEEAESEAHFVFEAAYVNGARHGPARVLNAKGSVLVTGNFCDELFCGTIEGRHPSGKPSFRAGYRAGLPQGTLKTFHDNGKLFESVRFANGVKHGASLAWSKDGTRLRLEGFDRGVRHGAWKEWHPSGVVRGAANFVKGTGRIEFRDEQGRLARTFELKGGTRHGEHTHYFEGNKRSSYPYKDGVLHGEQAEWHGNGKKRRVSPYKNGTLVGPVTQWHDNGKLRSKAAIANGRIVGVYRELDEEGRVSAEGNYDQAGRKTGAWTHYFEGKKTNVRTYDAGVLLESEWFW